MNEPTCLLQIRCPQPDCAGLGPQSAQINKARLQEMLDADEVSMFGQTCGHTWKLTKQERGNTAPGNGARAFCSTTGQRQQPLLITRLRVHGGTTGVQGNRRNSPPSSVYTGLLRVVLLRQAV
jgi:hypothetical protein